MGLQADIAAVRGDVPTHAQNFFIEFLAKHPENNVHFPDYAGKSGAQLKAMPKFVAHTKKVVDQLLEIMEQSGDAGKLKANAGKVMNASPHANLGASHFEGLFDTLIPFLQKTLGGSCAAAEWQQAGAAFVAQLKAAGMKA